MQTYTVQVEGVGRARGIGGGNGERDLDSRVGREGVNAAAGKEIGRAGGTAHDLQQDGNVGGGVRCAVNEEVRAVEVEGHV